MNKTIDKYTMSYVFFIIIFNIHSQNVKKIEIADLFKIYDYNKRIKISDTLLININDINNIFSYKKRYKPENIIYTNHYFNSNLFYINLSFNKDENNENIFIVKLSLLRFVKNIEDLDMFDSSPEDDIIFYIKRRKKKWEIIKVVYPDGSLKKRCWIKKILRKEDN